MHENINYIISYPRSGNTWLRYIIEILTQQPTNGLIGKPNKHDRLQKPLIISGDDYIAYKLHSFDKKISSNDSVIIVVRDFKECIIRHNKDKRGYDFELFKNHNQGKRDDYIGIIKHYDAFRGKKMIVYYEDIISKIRCTKVLPHIAAFFNVDYRKCFDVLSNWDNLKQKSLKLYPRSATKGIHETHHGNLLTNQQRLQWDRYLRDNFVNLYNKYLIRYSE